ncbi:MAG: FtsB family cell division protein [Bacteroidota bacterium]
MRLSELKTKTWFKILSNKYVLVSLLFCIWMLFLDTNSWLTHRELDQEKKELIQNEKYYIKEITSDKKTLQQLQDSVEIERFARENYFMKRPHEDIFIIEYEDSLKNND